MNYTDLVQGNYHVSIAYGYGCTVDTSFTVLFDYVQEENTSSDFIVDWKTGELRYTGSERMFDIEVYNAVGQLLLEKSSVGPNESVQLSISPQVIIVASAKGNFKTKVILK